ncbi:MAG TPA: hypothetical protein VIC71_00215 [Gammaproteobacteria bacterium]|jgi:hypothetical protein
MANENAYAEFERRIDALEAGYEFLLAYAAQGRHTDRGAAPERNVRTYLQNMEAALEGFGAAATACAAQRNAAMPKKAAAFFAAVERDAQTAQSVIRLVLAQDDIGSQIIDNLNASIHLRALLTDVFILDEALKPRA